VLGVCTPEVLEGPEKIFFFELVAGDATSQGVRGRVRAEATAMTLRVSAPVRGLVTLAFRAQSCDRTFISRRESSASEVAGQTNLRTHMEDLEGQDRQPQEAASALEIRHRNPSLLNL
jgi:hypothetical protein